jgi:N-terminal domain of anti-restriction factor ArdC
VAYQRLSRQERTEHAAAKIAAAQELLEHQVAALTSGEDWKRYLGLQAKLHAYSPNNVMLVYSQHAKAFAEGTVTAPEPGYVAGFNTWKALGRSVDKGQRGYAVLAPVRRTERIAVDGGGEARLLGQGEIPEVGEIEQVRQSIRGFKIEHVFSEYQTSGQPLPAAPRPRLLEGEAPRGLGQAVMELIEARGDAVDTVLDPAHLQGANGMTVWGSKQVLVRADMDDAAMVKTLIHEAAHVLLHETAPGMYLRRSRKEIEAESVAFVVADAHGMPTDDYSFPYVAAWASTGRSSDPGREITATQARVAEASKTILGASPAEHIEGGRVPGVEAAVEAARRDRRAAEKDPAFTSAVPVTEATSVAIGL